VDIDKLEISAKYGDVDAMFKLGEFYSSDEATLFEYPKAINYFKKASSLGHGPSFLGLARCHFYGLGVKKSYKLAHDYTREAIRSGSINARLFFSLFYLQGYGVEVNLDKAYDLVYDHLIKENAYAQYIVGNIYLRTNQIDKGVLYLSLSANNGLIEAANLLGSIYLNGDFVNKDEKLCKKWYSLAVKQGCKLSTQILAGIEYFSATLFKLVN
jgi:TPR repeat protein